MATLGAKAFSFSEEQEKEDAHLIGHHRFKVTYIHTSQMSYTGILNHVLKVDTETFSDVFIAKIIP